MKAVQLTPLKQRAARLGLGLGLAATLALGAVMPVGADDGTGTVVLNAGTRSVNIDNFSFAARTLNGVSQTTTAAPVIAVVDPSGSSLGWNVTMSATAFENTGATKTLVATPRVTAATLTDDNASGANHANAVSYGTPISIASSAKIASSAADATSNGAFTLTPTITIDIPYNTEVATYTSTVTVTITAAP